MDMCFFGGFVCFWHQECDGWGLWWWCKRGQHRRRGKGDEKWRVVRESVNRRGGHTYRQWHTHTAHTHTRRVWVITISCVLSEQHLAKNPAVTTQTALTRTVLQVCALYKVHIVCLHRITFIYRTNVMKATRVCFVPGWVRRVARSADEQIQRRSVSEADIWYLVSYSSLLLNTSRCVHCMGLISRHAQCLYMMTSIYMTNLMKATCVCFVSGWTRRDL